MTYIEGFVTPVRAADRARFTDHARRAAVLVRDLGATRVVDAWGDVPADEPDRFAPLVKLRDDETAGFGWMEFPDRATRDAFADRIESDPRVAGLGDMPFDGKRMIFGGFRVILSVGESHATGYVDGFVLPVPAAAEGDYQRHIAAAAAILFDHGATRYVAGWEDDVPAGTVTDFRMGSGATADEAVVFSWCEWPDAATRLAGMTATMADPRMAAMWETMPFDPERVVYGGFEMLNDEREGIA
jgi:uncharacterized protein YbaA (DUF1428 family)